MRKLLKNKTWFEILPWAWLIISYILTFVVIYLKGRYYVESDMASEMILADLLNEEGTIISKSWYYSSEIRIFYLQIFYRLALLIFPNKWFIARIFGQALWMLTLLVSYFFVCGTKGLNLKNHGVWGATCLACPFGIWYFWYGAFGGFYIPHMVLLLISLGLIIRIYKNNNRKCSVYFILFVIVCFINGLGSVKGIMAIYAPLCLASFLMLIKKLHISPNEKSTKEIKLFIISIISMISSGIGYLINTKILSTIYTFSINHGRTWGKLELSNFLDTLSDFLSVFGVQHPGYWNTEVNLFSLSGLLGAFAYVTIAILIISLIILIKKIIKLDFDSSFITFVFISSIFVQACVFAITSGPDVSSQSYWLTPMPLAFVLMEIAYKNVDLNWECSKKIIPIILLFSITCTSVASVNTFFSVPLQSKPLLEEPFEFLMYNNYKQGYASFWNGNVLTEWSNGEIEIWDVEFDDWGFTRLNKWLQLKEHDNKPQGGFFILTSEEELLYYNSINILEYSNIVYSDDNDYVIMTFDSLDDFVKAVEDAGLVLGE